MKILIEYESSWRNSFLDGNNNEPLPRGGRKFIGSMKNLRNAENFKQRSITQNTVMGVLNRLIGDQRKLYQSRLDEKYYFKDLDNEQVIRFEDIASKATITNEMTFIRNMTGSTDQNSFTGMIKSNNEIFLADYSQQFWGILALDFPEICKFISDGIQVEKTITANPLSIIAQLEFLNKEKAVYSGP